MKNFKCNPVDDSFQAFLVEGASFTEGEQYPIIEESMVSKNLPKQIVPFNKAIKMKNLSNTFICFYAPDKTFERIRRNPRRYLNLFTKKCEGIIGFDYSIHSDMPIIKQKSQTNDNLSLSYYYAKNGAKLIPNIRYGVDELADEFLEAIPKHSLVSIGTHGFSKTNAEKYEWFCFLEKVIKKFEPSGVIVYGNLEGKIFNHFKEKTLFYFYKPWIKQDIERRNNYGD